MRFSVWLFAGAMEMKLRRDEEKKECWSEAPLDGLVDGLSGELAELQQALQTGSKTDVLGECADVANYAMMISDRVMGTSTSRGMLPAPPPKETSTADPEHISVALKSVLAELEFSSTIQGKECCPVCHLDRDNGHSHDCAVKDAVRSIDVIKWDQLKT